jgi:hypothetical protein
MTRMWNRAQAMKLVNKVSKEDSAKGLLIFDYLYLGMEMGVTPEMKKMCREEVDREEKSTKKLKFLD